MRAKRLTVGRIAITAISLFALAATGISYAITPSDTLLALNDVGITINKAPVVRKFTHPNPHEHYLFIVLDFGATKPRSCDTVKIKVLGVQLYDIVGIGVSPELADDPITFTSAHVDAPGQLTLKRCNISNRKPAQELHDQMVTIDVWTPDGGSEGRE